MFYRFDQFPLSPLSLKALEDAGFKTMTVVQEATLPIILKGEHFFSLNSISLELLIRHKDKGLGFRKNDIEIKKRR